MNSEHETINVELTNEQRLYLISLLSSAQVSSNQGDRSQLRDGTLTNKELSREILASLSTPKVNLHIAFEKALKSLPETYGFGPKRNRR